MPASFGLVPELTHKVKDKKLRYKAYQKRSLEVLKEFKKNLENSSLKRSIPF
jgi:folate-dependent tRNA-U54 methylase TrmFO/GidA